jgi:integrase
MALAMARPWKHPQTGIYWLRKRVPDDLRAAVGKLEEKFSLRTRDPAEAKRRHVEALVALEERWGNLRALVRKLDGAELHGVSLAAYSWCVGLKGPPGIIWDSDAASHLWDDEVYDVHRPFDLLSDAATARSVAKTVHRSWCQARAKGYLADHGLKVDDEDEAKIAKAIGAGAQQAVLSLKRQANGDFSLSAPAPQASSFQNPVPDARQHEKFAFQSLLQGWAAEKQPTQKTLYSWTRVVDQLAAFVGHADAVRITPEDLLRWKTSLLEAGLRTKTIRDSKIAPLRAILQWGVDNRKLAANPAARIVIDVRSRMTERIRGFTEEEAGLILQHAAREQDPVRRWVPLLCAYSGARLSEVCQLRVKDIFQQGEIWCMKFDPEAGSLKNENSERAVPLHPAIVASGFLKFVKAIGTGPVFANLAADRFGNRGGNGTKVLGKWVRGLGLTDERLSPSHSWRHRFKTLGRQFGLAPDIVNAITGHHRKTVADSYGEFPVEALSRELLKIPTLAF